MGKAVRRIIIGLAVLLLAVLLVFSGMVIYVTRPARVTSIVNNYASSYLNADVHFDAVSVSLFSDLPFVGLKLGRGEIISHALGREADTLMRFDEFSMSLNVLKLMRSELEFKGISLLSPEINLFVAEDGRANWEIYESTGEDTSALDYGLSLDRFEMKDGRVVYHSALDSLYGDVVFANAGITQKGRNEYILDIDASATLKMDTLTCLDRLDISLDGGLGFDLRHSGRYDLRDMNIRVGELPFMLDGSVEATADSISSDLKCSVSPASLMAVLGLVPKGMLPAEAANVRSDISVDMEAYISGSYNFATGALPRVTLDVKVDKGYLAYEGVNARIDDFKIDATMRYDPLCADSTSVVVRDMELHGSGVFMDGHISVNDLLGDPFVDACLKGHFNFTTITSLLPIPDDISVGGVARYDIDATGRLSSFDIAKPGKIYVNAALWFDDFHLNSPHDTLSFLADKSRFTIGVNANSKLHDTLMDKKGEVLYLTASADTLNFNYKDRFFILASHAAIEARNAVTSLSGNRTKVHPLYGSGELAFLELRGPDSTYVRANDAFTAFSVMPLPEDKSVPVVKFSIGAMGLTMQSGVNLCRLNGTNLDFEATLVKPDEKSLARRERALDSLQTIYPEIKRDSLFAYMLERRKFVTVKDDFADYDIDMMAPLSMSGILYNWDAKGSIYAISGYAVTPYFPVENRIGNIDLSFTTDQVRLNGIKIKAGKSDVELKGDVSNIRQVLIGRGSLQAGMMIRSDTLDFNELVRTINAGADFIYKENAYIDQLKDASNEEHLKSIIAENQDVSEASSLLVLPSNVEMNIDLDVEHGIYAGLELRSLTGNCVVRDRILQVNDLNAVTSAGEVDLNAIYATRSREDISTGFDIEIKDVDVNKFISIIPSVDTLFPMMRSFEGKLNCQMAAAAKLDTSMNILLPTLQAAARIHGENMVLLDGETFTEISKMLKFKQRDRNLIDKISVEMLVRNNQVEMFPFVVEMDRYKAAISGIHKLDMSFNYHISVLHSPIPFRFGLNISGTLDKMKYRIGKARYKSDNVPTYFELIDSTRVNLREAITDIFHRGMEAAVISGMDVASGIVVNEELGAHTEELSAEESVILEQAGAATDTLSAVQAPDSVHNRSLGKNRRQTMPDNK